MAGRPWTAEEIEAVLAAGDEPALRAAAEEIGRTFYAAKHKRRRLLNPPPRPAPERCSVNGCERRVEALGRCGTHAKQSRRHAAALGRPLNRNTVVRASRSAAPEGPTAAERRRGELRRKIEDLETALRLKREDQLLREGDW